MKKRESLCWGTIERFHFFNEKDKPTYSEWSPFCKIANCADNQKQLLDKADLQKSGRSRDKGIDPGSRVLYIEKTATTVDQKAGQSV